MNHCVSTAIPIGVRMHERGMTTLVMALVLLFLISLVTFTVTRSISVEQKVANNDERSRVAFEAAEAGLASALENFRLHAEHISEETNWTCPDANLDDPDCYFDLSLLAELEDESGNSLVDDNGNPVQVPCENIENASCEVRIYPNLLSDEYNQIQSRGYSDDFTATRVVYQAAKKLDAIGELPGVPLIATSNVGQAGSYTIVNPEGNSTIWSGDQVGEQGEGMGTFVASPFGDEFPGCMDSPLLCDVIDTTNSSLGSGLDVVEKDDDLGDLSIEELFKLYFGMDSETYKEIGTDIVTTEGSDEYLNTKGKVIWIQENPDDNDQVISFTSNDVIGCLEKKNGLQTVDLVGVEFQVCPDAIDYKNNDEFESTITIIEGDVSFTGTPHFSGVVFILGRILKGAGDPTFIGAMLAEDGNFGGNPTIVFHSGYTAEAKILGSYYALPGTWRDFDQNL
jgi:hypothetical protein